MQRSQDVLHTMKGINTVLMKAMWVATFDWGRSLNDEKDPVLRELGKEFLARRTVLAKNPPGGKELSMPEGERG